MKILIISDAWHPQINGVVRTYEYIGAALEDMGHDVHVIGPSDFPRRFNMPGYSEIELVVAPYKRLSRMIIDHAPDTIHIATEGPLGWAARRYCLKNNVSFTSSYHTHFPDYVAKRVAKFLPFLYRPAHALAKAHVRRFHAPSDALMIATKSLEDQLCAWKFTAPIYRLTRGVKLDQFYVGEGGVFADMAGPIALYVGRVAIEKNIESFLSMDWAGTKVVVGDGPSRADLQRQYPEAHFVGTKQGVELAEHYRDADVFVFPSKTDTFGIVLIEALASGLPIAAYNVTGPKDIVTDDTLGVLSDHDDGLSAAAMSAVSCGSPQARADHVRGYYTWENAATQFIAATENSMRDKK